MNAHTHLILFFDGECNLCNGFVQFVIRHDKKKLFLFAPLQSTAGKEAIKHFNGNVPDSVILFYNNTYYVRSAAGLHVLRLLNFPWALLYAGIIIPRFIRDWGYDLVARNRYKWFGKRAECMIPTPELNGRFLY